MTQDRPNKDRRVVHCNIIILLGKIPLPKESRSSNLGKGILSVTIGMRYFRIEENTLSGGKSTFSAIKKIIF